MKIEGKPFSAFDAAKLPGGLVPAVIQDDRTLQVLMLGYMNREAYEKSLAEGRVTFYSRSRQRLWTKGETSGNWLDIVSVAADCDCDTLLIRVIPHGPTCHTGVENLLRRGRARNRRFHPLPAKRHPGTSRRDARRLLHLEALQPRREQDRAEGRRGGCRRPSSRPWPRTARR